MDISECIAHDDGELEYRTLYKYHISRNIYIGGGFHIEGEFVKENTPSDNLCAKLMRGGVPKDMLEQVT